MKALLFSRTGLLAGANFEIADEATIGKAPGNSIQLYPQVISKKHARIFYDDNENCYFIEDLKSRNGTKVDGIRVRTKERLDKLNVIKLANVFDFVFLVIDDVQVGSRKAEPPPVLTEVEPRPLEKKQVRPVATVVETVSEDVLAAPIPPLTPDIAPSGDVGGTRPDPEFLPVPPLAEAKEFSIEIVKSDGTTTRFKLKEGENLIGREATCDVFIQNSSVGRRHAIVTVKNGKITLKDLGSKNHTFVNDVEIRSEVEISPGTGLKFALVSASLVEKKSG
ncbi:MAG: FHA domain-containing protein [Bacteroidota bacterium]